MLVSVAPAFFNVIISPFFVVVFLEAPIPNGSAVIGDKFAEIFIGALYGGVVYNIVRYYTVIVDFSVSRHRMRLGNGDGCEGDKGSIITVMVEHVEYGSMVDVTIALQF